MTEKIANVQTEICTAVEILKKINILACSKALWLSGKIFMRDIVGSPKRAR